MSELSRAVEEAANAMNRALEVQAEELVKALTAASAEAGRDAIDILRKIHNVRLWLVDGSIDAATARISAQNYIETLKLTYYRLETEAQVEAWKRGVVMLDTFARVAFAVLELALQAAVPGVGVFLSGVVERVAGGLKS